MTLSTPVILGLDPSTKLIGWGLTTMEGQPFHCDCAHFPEDGWIDVRIRETVKDISQQIRARGAEVVEIAVEHPLSYQRRSKAEVLWACAQTAQAAGAHFGVEVHEYTDMEWKSIVGHHQAPRDPENRRRTLKADALFHHVVASPDFPAFGEEEAAVYRAHKGQHHKNGYKTHLYAKALELGFEPDGSQDAADGGLISYAHWTRVESYAAKAALI